MIKKDRLGSIAALPSNNQAMLGYYLAIMPDIANKERIKAMKIKLEKLVSITESNVGQKRDKVEHGFYKEIAVIHDERSTPCRFRFYNTGQTIHCIAWLSGDEHYTSGYGKADGYGYCKESAAMESAIIDSGIAMDQHWGGMGETKQREAAFSIAQKLTGKRKFILHTAHA